MVGIIWVICGVIAGGVWESKGGSFAAGFWLGALLGVLGLFYVAFANPMAPSVGGGSTGETWTRVPAKLKTCPRCAEEVKAAALVCRFCGHEFPQEKPAPGPEPERYRGEAITDVVEHAFGVTWGRTAAGDVVYRPKGSDEWLLYDRGTTPLVPPASHRAR